MVREQVKLKAILRERGISAYRLAKDCGIATANMYNILGGRQYAYPGWRRKIADYLNLPEEALFIDGNE